MTDRFNESTVEEAALSWFDELGYGEIRVADAEKLTVDNKKPHVPNTSR